MRRKGPEDPTRLRLASERSEAEIAAERRRSDAERAAEALNDAVRELAANLLRVIAGAGKQHALIDEAIAFLKAYRELQPTRGVPLTPTVQSPQWEGVNRPRLEKEKSGVLACVRFRRHREKVFAEAGGGAWEGGYLRGSSRLRRSG
jgi:hypothetical protein